MALVSLLFASVALAEESAAPQGGMANSHWPQLLGNLARVDSRRAAGRTPDQARELHRLYDELMARARRLADNIQRRGNDRAASRKPALNTKIVKKATLRI